MSYRQGSRVRFYVDPWVLGCAMVLSIMGLLTVASASMVISDQQYHHPFYFLLHQGMYWVAALVVGVLVFRLEPRFWLRFSGYALLIGMVLLVAVLLPGIGRTINGSRRWLSLGVATLQASEWVKFAVVLYFASYLKRRGQLLREQLIEVAKPLLIVSVLGVLLLLEPDYGATVVIVTTVMGLLFLGGMRLWQIASLIALAALMLALLAWLSPYRLARLTSFLHPWKQQFTGGYQLTQSLIALGRGGFWGVGLGNSIQKLFYLPEAHTDFIFAILTEELGFIGSVGVIALYGLMVGRIFWIARCAMRGKHAFDALVAYGVGLWIAIQAIINIGVNVGMFPTKGITLPLMSYGGSSLLITAVALGVVLRIGHESWAHH